MWLGGVISIITELIRMRGHKMSNDPTKQCSQRTKVMVQLEVFHYNSDKRQSKNGVSNGTTLMTNGKPLNEIGIKNETGDLVTKIDSGAYLTGLSRSVQNVDKNVYVI